MSSDRATKLLESAEELAGAGKTEEALKAANQALAIFRKEGNKAKEAELLCEVVVDAYIARGDAENAMVAANQALMIAQKERDTRAEAAAWYSITVARFAGRYEDAPEAADKALGLYQGLGDKSKQAATLLYQARGHLMTENTAAAMKAARESRSIAVQISDGLQAASATDLIASAHIAGGDAGEALREAEEQLSSIESSGDRRGVVTAMGAVVRAVVEKEDEAAGLARVKELVESSRAAGDERAEAAMLHRLALMASSQEEALNAAQVALELAEKAGDAREEASIKDTLTEIWAAKGKIDRAPNRREALEILRELGKALEAKNGDKFDDTAKRLARYHGALKQHDFQKVVMAVVDKNPPVYREFLKEHGMDVGEEAREKAHVGAERFGVAPKQVIYYAFRGGGGVNYGPRYRTTWGGGWLNTDKTDQAVGIIELQDCHEDWEREVLYNAPWIDSQFHVGMAGSLARQIGGVQ